jgi:hypothetical protein
MSDYDFQPGEIWDLHQCYVYENGHFRYASP